jgi:hypothetical protein
MTSSPNQASPSELPASPRDTKTDVHQSGRGAARPPHIGGKRSLVLVDRWNAGLLAAGLTLGGAVSLLALWHPTDMNLLALAAALAIVAATITASRLYRMHGWVDLFHPLLFPSIYAGITFLLPTWLLLVQPESVGFPTHSPIATSAAILMAAAAASFALGCATTWIARPPSGPSNRGVSPRRLRIMAWALLAIPLVAAFRDLSNKVVFTRGLHQTTMGLWDHTNALAAMAAPAAVLLLLAAQQLAGHKRLLQPMDWLGVAALLTAFGMNGGRTAALAVLLVILYQWSRRRQRGSLALLGIIAIAVLAYVVVTYRGTAVGDGKVSFFHATILDINPALFTTGATAAAIPSTTPYLDGGTYLAGLLRQIPGPLATSLLGLPDDTGTFVFRRIIGYDNPNMGFAFSVPAEGYMNFGIAGLIAACSALGLVLAWSYRRSGDYSRPIHLLYPLLIGTLPCVLRSDFLGALKGVLYPILMISLAYLVARPRSARQEIFLKRILTASKHPERSNQALVHRE